MSGEVAKSMLKSGSHCLPSGRWNWRAPPHPAPTAPSLQGASTSALAKVLSSLSPVCASAGSSVGADAEQRGPWEWGSHREVPLLCHHAVGL